MSDIYSLLGNVQQTLHAPKGQTNSFGGYQYRSAEDILEAVKPVLAANNLTLLVSDEMVAVGDRIYVKARAEVLADDGASVHSFGWAREPADKKGMDSSQITGAASSYARKYALNGLFAIDDSKDADSDEHRRQIDSAPKSVAKKSAAKVVPPKHVQLQTQAVEVCKSKGIGQAEALAEFHSIGGVGKISECDDVILLAQFVDHLEGAA